MKSDQECRDELTAIEELINVKFGMLEGEDTVHATFRLLNYLHDVCQLTAGLMRPYREEV